MYSTLNLPIRDPPRRGHFINNLSTKDMLPVRNDYFLILLIHFEPLKSGQPLYKGQGSWPQCVHCSEVPLYMCIYNLYDYDNLCMYNILDRHTVQPNPPTTDTSFNNPSDINTPPIYTKSTITTIR